MVGLGVRNKCLRCPKCLEIKRLAIKLEYRDSKIKNELQTYIIILGGDDSKGNEIKNIYWLNLVNNEINVIGKNERVSLYIGQSIQLDESIIVIYDSKNGLHFFNKEMDYHEIYNFNIWVYLFNLKYYFFY